MHSPLLVCAILKNTEGFWVMWLTGRISYRRLKETAGSGLKKLLICAGTGADYNGLPILRDLSLTIREHWETGRTMPKRERREIFAIVFRKTFDSWQMLVNAFWKSHCLVKFIVKRDEERRSAWQGWPFIVNDVNASIYTIHQIPQMSKWRKWQMASYMQIAEDENICIEN